MQLDLTDEEAFALLDLLTETIEADRYSLSPDSNAASISRRSARWDRYGHAPQAANAR